MTEDRHEFSVCVFYPGGTYEYVKRWIKAEEAVRTFREWTESNMAKRGHLARIIVTDGGDCTNMEWKFGEGITYPTAEMLRKK